MVPVMARYAENPPKLPHMAADIESKTNERVFQYPYRRAIENDGINIAAIIATKLSGCGPQAQTKVIGLIRQRTNNFPIKATTSVSPGGDGTIFHTISAETNSQTPNATIIEAKFLIRFNLDT